MKVKDLIKRLFIRPHGFMGGLHGLLSMVDGISPISLHSPHGSALRADWVASFMSLTGGNYFLKANDRFDLIITCSRTL